MKEAIEQLIYSLKNGRSELPPDSVVASSILALIEKRCEGIEGVIREKESCDYIDEDYTRGLCTTKELATAIKEHLLGGGG